MKLKMNHIDKWKNSNGKIFPLVNEKTWYNFSVLHYYIALGNGVIEIVYFFFFFLIEFVPVRKRCFRPPSLFSEKAIEWNEWNERFVRSTSDIYIFSTQAFITLPFKFMHLNSFRIILLSRDPSPNSHVSRWISRNRNGKLVFIVVKAFPPPFSFKRYCSNSILLLDAIIKI